MEQSEVKKSAADGLARVPTTSKSFLRTWLEIMVPFHHLTPREMDFAAALIAKREEIAASVDSKKSPALVDKILFDKETRQEVMDKAGITKSYAPVIFQKMKDVGFIQDKKDGGGKRINPSYLPTWKKGEPFRMVFVFENRDET